MNTLRAAKSRARKRGLRIQAMYQRFAVIDKEERSTVIHEGMIAEYLLRRERESIPGQAELYMGLCDEADGPIGTV